MKTVIESLKELKTVKELEELKRVEENTFEGIRNVKLSDECKGSLYEVIEVFIKQIKDRINTIKK